MSRTFFSTILVAIALQQQAEAWSVPLSRRQAFAQAASAAAGVASVSSILTPDAAFAEVSEETPRVTTRMGGNLESFQDGPRSVRLMAPSGESFILNLALLLTMIHLSHRFIVLFSKAGISSKAKSELTISNGRTWLILAKISRLAALQSSRQWNPSPLSVMSKRWARVWLPSVMPN